MPGRRSYTSVPCTASRSITAPSTSPASQPGDPPSTVATTKAPSLLTANVAPSVGCLFQSARLQAATVWSVPPVTNQFPSAAATTDVTRPACPVYSRVRVTPSGFSSKSETP